MSIALHESYKLGYVYSQGNEKWKKKQTKKKTVEKLWWAKYTF